MGALLSVGHMGALLSKGFHAAYTQRAGASHGSHVNQSRQVGRASTAGGSGGAVAAARPAAPVHVALSTRNVLCEVQLSCRRILDLRRRSVFCF